MNKLDVPRLFTFLLVVLSFNIVIGQKVIGHKVLLPPCDHMVVEKVKTAMLCMQRYSWEHGTAMQGMLEIGDTTI